MTKTASFALLFFFLLFTTIQAQLSKTDPFYRAIMSKDSLLFSVGFNTCNSKQIEDVLSKDFQFYHDKDGFSDQKKFIADFKNGLCKASSIYRYKRILVDKSIQVYPMFKDGKIYAAVQNGEHLFYEKEGRAEKLAGEAKFTNFWLLENGDWKLAKSLSFDHHAKETIDKGTVFNNDLEIENWLKENKIPTLGLGIIDSGELKQIKMFGDIKKGSAAPYNTYFNVASLTKPVTAIVALRLISLGKWKLDEPLDAYWTDPDVTSDPRHKKITTRLILSHQTGFPNWRWMNTDKKLNFEFEPGTQYQYSGEGFEYLRKALEKKFKKTLDQLARELIFQPLQMNDTNYIWDKNTDESRFAIGYNDAGTPYLTEKNKITNAADDLHTTIGDYGNFMVNVMKGKNLKPEVFQEMITKQVKTKENKYFGLGFEIYDLGKGEYALSHSGADQGTKCIVFVLPKSGKGLLIFTNTDDGYKIYEKLVIHYLGDEGQRIADIESK